MSQQFSTSQRSSSVNHDVTSVSGPAGRRCQPSRAATLLLIPGVFAVLTAAAPAAGVAPGDHAPFTATAYCDRGTTKAGVRAQRGVAAADPSVLPVGSVVQVAAQSPEHEGVYTVMDTGGKVVGRRIDLYVSDCQQAKRFGLQRVLVRVLRLGWNPRASAVPAAPRMTYASLAPSLGGPLFAQASGAATAVDDLSDGAITAKVKSRLALDEAIRSRDIHVATKDAVVTLSGQVASDTERAKAVKIASDTDGVKSVVDHLEIKK